MAYDSESYAPCNRWKHQIQISLNYGTLMLILQIISGAQSKILISICSQAYMRALLKLCYCYQNLISDLNSFYTQNLLKHCKELAKKPANLRTQRKVILNAFSFASSGNTLKISRCPWLKIASWFCCLSLKKCYRLVEVDKRFQDTVAKYATDIFCSRISNTFNK